MLQEEAKKLPQGEVKPNGKYNEGAWFKVIDAEAKRLKVDPNKYLDELGKNDEYKKAFRQEAINQGQNYDDWVAQGGIIGGVPVKRDLRYKAVGPQTAAKWKEHYAVKETKPTNNVPELLKAPNSVEKMPGQIDRPSEYIIGGKSLWSAPKPGESSLTNTDAKEGSSTTSATVVNAKDSAKKDKNNKEDKGLFSSSDSPYRYTNALYNTLRGLSGPDKTAAVPLRLNRYKDKTDTEQLRQDVLIQQKIFDRNANNAYASKGESGASKAMSSANTIRSLADVNRIKYERSDAIRKANTELSNQEITANNAEVKRVNDEAFQHAKAAKDFTGAGSLETTQQKQQAIIDSKKDENDKLMMEMMNSNFKYKIGNDGKISYQGSKDMSEKITKYNEYIDDATKKGLKINSRMDFDAYIATIEDPKKKAEAEVIYKEIFQ
jgi:hypothetical protein